MLQVLDCTYPYPGCLGGDPQNAYKSIVAHGGLENQTTYPWAGFSQEGCAFTGNAPLPAEKITGYETADNELKTVLNATGPVSVCLAAEDWQFYTGGILMTCSGIAVLRWCCFVINCVPPRSCPLVVPFCCILEIPKHPERF